MNISMTKKNLLIRDLILSGLTIFIVSILIEILYSKLWVFAYVLGNILREVCYDAIFISGVGQDHIDEGNGFWNGLDFLEKTLG